MVLGGGYCCFVFGLNDPLRQYFSAGGGWFGHFYSNLSFLLFLPLFGRWPDID